MQYHVVDPQTMQVVSTHKTFTEARDEAFSLSQSLKRSVEVMRTPTPYRHHQKFISLKW